MKQNGINFRLIYIDKNIYKGYNVVTIKKGEKMPYKEYDQNAGYLLPPYIEDLIGEDHIARVFNEIIDMIDISELLAKEKPEGRERYHPRMMVKVLLYSYSEKRFASREMDRSCKEDVVYMWLSGMARPNFRTISDFRKDNIEILKKIFVQVVRICRGLGITKMGLVAIDGSKVKSVSSDSGAKSEEKLEEALKEIEQEIGEYLARGVAIDEGEDALYGRENKGYGVPKKILKKIKQQAGIKKAIAEIKTIKEADKSRKKDPKINPVEDEARFMKHNGGRIRLSYNCQAAVDESGVIVAADITNEANDKRQLVPMLKEVEDTAGEKPQQAALDAGYHSQKNLEDTKNSGIDLYITEKKWEEEIKENGSKDEKPNVIDDKNMAEVVHMDLSGAENRLGGEGKNVAVENVIDDKSETDVVLAMRKKLASEAGREIYGKRKEIVEPVFGQVKSNRGFTRFRLRGQKKARGEWLLVCIGHNIRKINSYLINLKNNLKPEGGVLKNTENISMGSNSNEIFGYCGA